jgi:predicted ester cyclase
MQDEHNHEHMEEVYRRLIQVGFSQGEVAVVDDLFTPDFVEHQAGVHPATAEGVKGLIAYLHRALPDIAITIEDVAVVGDKVWGRLRARGAQRGSFLGVPPTGNAIDVEIIDICRFDGGKIAEHWGYSDRLSTLEQLGAAPRPLQEQA